MRFKKLLILVGVILVINIELVLAQKANVKNVNVEYIVPPEKPLKSNVKDFYSEVTNKVLEFPLMIEQEQQRIHLKGYKRALKKEDADFLVEFKVNSAKFEMKVFKANYEKKINDSISVTRVGAKYEVKAYLGTSVNVKDVANNKVLKSVIGNVAEKTYLSKIYHSYNGAVENVNNNRYDDAKKLYKEIYDSQVHNLVNYLNKNYGFSKDNIFLPISRGKGKRYDYSDLQNAFEKFSEVATLYNKGELTDDALKELDECISIWADAIKEYQPKTRKTRIGDKNIGSLYVNTACAFFLKKEWNKVHEYLEKSKEYKGQKVAANILNRIAGNLERLYKLQPHDDMVAEN